ncbi:MAG: hypothetical protein U0800_25520 [Isosphaeraceae bacterium]
MTTPIKNSADLEIEILRSEIAAMKRAQRRIRIVSLSSAVAFAVGLCLVGARPQEPREVKSEKFVLVDAKGQERAILTCQDDGAPIFSMKDPKNKEKLLLHVDNTGNALMYMMDDDETPRIILNSDLDGPCQLAFMGNDGMSRLVLESDDDGEKSELLIMQGGEIRSTLRYSNGGVNGLTVRGKPGAHNAHVGQDDRDKVFIGFTDTEGGIVNLHRVDDAGNTYNEILDPKTGKVSRKYNNQE